jgi:hypothetical protein
MERLGPQIGALNFQDAEYLDTQGKARLLIRFSQDVILNVCSAIGGPVEHLCRPEHPFRAAIGFSWTSHSSGATSVALPT